MDQADIRSRRARMEPLSFVRFAGSPESTALNRRMLSPVRAASNMRWANSIVSGGSCDTSGFIS